MNREQKIAKIRSIIRVWGSFSPSEVEEDWSLCVGELGNLVGLVEYLSLDCIDVSVYSSDSFSSDSVHDYTMEYSKLSDEVLKELVQLCNKYNELMLEQQEE